MRKIGIFGDTNRKLFHTMRKISVCFTEDFNFRHRKMETLVQNSWIYSNFSEKRDDYDGVGMKMATHWSVTIGLKMIQIPLFSAFLSVFAMFLSEVKFKLTPTS